MSGRGRRWAFTYWSIVGQEEATFTEYAPKFFENILRIKYAVWQLERGPECGRLHIQGYLELDSSQRMLATKALIKASTGDDRVKLLQAKGTRAQNVVYCTKPDSKVAGPWYVRTEGDSEQGKRNDLHRAAEAVRDGGSMHSLMEESPHLIVRYSRGFQNLISLRDQHAARTWRTLRVLVFYGDAGTGKTRQAVENSGEDYYILDQGERVWFDGYAGEKTLIIDDFYGWIKYGMLLRILDGYTYRCEIKGAFCWGLWTTVYITSNKRPSEWYQTGLTPALERRINQVRRFTLVDDVVIDNKSDW